MAEKKDHTGHIFGRLTVICEAVGYGKNFSSTGAWWKCICECGNEKIADAESLRRGRTKSCGCLRREVTKARATKHGKAHHECYRIYKGIKGRCLNPNAPSYQNYGARGITICDRWLDNFENFLADMGPRPSPEHSVDRIDNDKGYSPDNCRWATATEQMRNTRMNHLVEVDGKQITLQEAIDQSGLNGRTVRARLNRGWSIDDALNIKALPVGEKMFRRASA